MKQIVMDKSRLKNTLQECMAQLALLPPQKFCYFFIAKISTQSRLSFCKENSKTTTTALLSTKKVFKFTFDNKCQLSKEVFYTDVIQVLPTNKEKAHKIRKTRFIIS